MTDQPAKTEDIQPPPLPPFEDKVLGVERKELLGLPLRWQDTLSVVLLIILADVLLYRVAGGAGIATLLIVTMIVVFALRGRQMDLRLVKVGAVITALAGILIWHVWWLAIFMAIVWIFRLAVGLWRPDWGFLESFFASVQSIFNAPVRVLGHVAALNRVRRDTDRKPLPARVVLIPLGVSVLFVFVFASANPILSDKFAALWTHIEDFFLRIGEYLSAGRVFFWVGWLLVFAILIRPVLRSETVKRFMQRSSTLDTCEMTSRIETNALVAMVTLICVNLVFLAYNGMDSVYLYFKATLPAGINWTDYTHSGCGWLTFGLFLSTVVLGVIFWRELNFHPRASRLKRWAYIWIAQNAILAIGTLRRIYMYIDYSGLTHLLVTGVYGSLLVMAGLIIMVIKVRQNRSAIWLLRKYVTAFVIALTILALTPLGLICASYNAPRVLQEKPNATWPMALKQLEAEAMPPLIPLLDYTREDGDAEKERIVRQGIAAILGQQLVNLEHREDDPWTQWQASSKWALKHLRLVRERIYETVPPEEWHAARQRLREAYYLCK